ncbi:MAG: hypothetical protein V4440_07245 [Pseudomonadota bacterium]
MTKVEKVDDGPIDIQTLLAGISNGAMFYIGTDADEFLYVRAAGQGYPYETAWCKKGWRKSKIYDDEEPQPLLRDEFVDAVLARDDFLDVI